MRTADMPLGDDLQSIVDCVRRGVANCKLVLSGVYCLGPLLQPSQQAQHQLLHIGRAFVKETLRWADMHKLGYR